MTLFEYLMVLVSIIVGLGIAEILTGIAKQIRYGYGNSGYWVHSCGVALIFLALLQTWWELWDLNQTPMWTFHSLILMLLAPSVLYLIAHLIFPDPVKGARFRDYHYGPMRSIWLLGGVVVLASTLFRPVAFGSELVTWDNFSSLFLLAGFVTLARTANRTIHSVLVPSFLVLLLWDIVRWHPAIAPGQ